MEVGMSVAKVIELTARSTESFEDAVQQAVQKAGESVHAIREAWIQDQKVRIEDGKVAEYQVDVKITFLVD
jgi:dodecin